MATTLSEHAVSSLQPSDHFLNDAIAIETYDFSSKAIVLSFQSDCNRIKSTCLGIKSTRYAEDNSIETTSTDDLRSTRMQTRLLCGIAKRADAEKYTGWNDCLNTELTLIDLHSRNTTSEHDRR